MSRGRTLLLPRLLSAALLAPGLQAAQEPVVLVRVGDVVPGVGTVTSIDHLSLDSTGRWRVEVDTDHPDPAADSVVLGPEGIVVREGDALAGLPGASVDTFDAQSLNDQGDVVQNLTLAGTSGGSSDDQVVVLGSDVLLQKGGAATAPGFGPGATYVAFLDARLTDNRRVLVRGFANDPSGAGPLSTFALRLDLDPAGNVVGETLVALEGQVPPGQVLALDDVRTGPHSGAVDSGGSVLWCGELSSQALPDDAVIYLDGTLLAQEGNPSPVPGRNWGSLLAPEVDLNDAGSWVIQDFLDGTDPSTDDVIVRDGVVVARAGDPHPTLPAFHLESFGSGPVRLAESGELLWYADWDDPDTTRDEGLFLDGQPLVQEGVTRVEDLLLTGVASGLESRCMSADGRLVLFEGTLSDGSVAALLVESGTGTSTCSSPANSSGAPAVLRTRGAALAGQDLFGLAAEHLPPNQFGYFLASRSQGLVVGPGGSQGVLCLGGSIGRYASLVASSGVDGRLWIDVDLGAMPLTPSVPVLAGETWYFQAWFRDLNPGVTSNFSDGVGVLFR